MLTTVLLIYCVGNREDNSTLLSNEKVMHGELFALLKVNETVFVKTFKYVCCLLVYCKIDGSPSLNTLPSHIQG